MKNNKGFIGMSAIIAGGLALLALVGGGTYVAKNRVQNQVARQQLEQIQESNFSAQHMAQMSAFALQELTQAEKDGLVQMREEEKLARDVYTALYEKWGINTFKNIASSENTHTLAIKALLERYGITDPAQSDTAGVFANETLQGLYTALVEKGSTSLIDALSVGATVEDLDIKDLQDFIAQTDNDDVAFVYENLMRGSRNHLRAFNAQIQRNGQAYSAQYLTQGEVDEILATPHERGNAQMQKNQNQMNVQGQNQMQNKGQVQGQRGGMGTGAPQR